MRQLLSTLALGAAVLALVACASAPTTGAARPPAGKLILTGSSTIAPLASEIAKKFESAHPGVRVDVQSGGSSRGIGDARQGVADIGMVSRALKEDESDLKGYTIALQVFGRPPSFDAQSDPLVRVEALRLRQRLTEYYAGEGATDPVRLQLPRGSYAVKAVYASAEAPAAEPAPAPATPASPPTP